MKTGAARASDPTKRSLLTPEGVPLPFRLADGAERAGAFLIDFLAITALVVAVFWFASLLGLGGAWATALLYLGVFLITNFYFILFELRWMGATPGKKLIGIRVIDRRGGPLRADAIVARNLMRQAELWIPIVAVLAPEQLFGPAPAAVKLIASIWVFIFVLLPLFNKDRLRAGDIVGGTAVVYRPKAVLLPDLGDKSSTNRTHGSGFSQAQLDVYGIYELQVLEKLLRGRDTIERDQSLVAVSEQIKEKIGWAADTTMSPEQFLHSFYVALRASLENKMLYGKRVTDKYSAQRPSH